MSRQIRVAIIGAGPAGMLLAHILHQRDISVLVLEKQSRAYIESRIRAGVLEPGTVKLLDELDVSQRLHTEGLIHQGVNIRSENGTSRIDLAKLTNGLSVTVYGQQEVMKDLLAAADQRGIEVVYEAQDIQVSGLDKQRVSVSWSQQDIQEQIEAEFLAGCDGAHGLTRSLASGTKALEFSDTGAWLGILANVAPIDDELIYGQHENGFVLASMRSPTRSRYYIQCAPGTVVDEWPDERLWDEICLRLGRDLAGGLERGPALEKSVTPLRGLVTEPMQSGRLFLAGDAAHIVPPTGAKGLNLAAADVSTLAGALTEHYVSGSEVGLRNYSKSALRRVWRAQRFSWWFTRLTHKLTDQGTYQSRLHAVELEHLLESETQQRVFAEHYVGLY